MIFVRFSFFILSFVLFGCFYSSPIRTIALKQNTISVNWEERTNEAVRILQDLIRIRTERKNEIEVVRYLQALLQKEGIPSRIYASKEHPEHANLVAVLEPKKPNTPISSRFSNLKNRTILRGSFWEITATSSKPTRPNGPFLLIRDRSSTEKFTEEEPWI